MSETTPDLTRWNRAGLSRFRYVDGNAVTWLERLRANMAERFGQDDGWRLLTHDVRPDESTEEFLARVLHQYNAQQRDYAWELLRTFARSTYVLTEHIDAFANETFIGTATQWHNVRRLVSMLDYRPAPPASAKTPLVIHAAKDATVAGPATLAAGFRAKNAPVDGSAPVTFETLADLDIDHGLNRLRLRDWHVSNELFDYTPGTPATATFELPEEADALSIGALGVLVAKDTGIAAEVTGVIAEVPGVTKRALTLTLETPPAATFPATLGQVSLLTNPGLAITPRLAGDNAMELTSGHGYLNGDVLAWRSGTSWLVNSVSRISGLRLLMANTTPLPSTGDSLYRLTQGNKHSVTTSHLAVPIQRDATEVWDEDLIQRTTTRGVDHYDYITGHSRVFYLAQGTKSQASIVASSVTSLEVDGNRDDIVTGTYLVFLGVTKTAHRVAQVEAITDGYRITAEPAPSDPGASFFAFAPDLVQPRDHDRNLTPALTTTSSNASTLILAAPKSGDYPALLAKGRGVVLATDAEAFAATVHSLDTATGELTVTPAINSTATTFATVVHANVSDAIHGESQPARTLGSGDATRSMQTFEMPAKDVTFVPDASMTAGVRADIEVTVANERWQQVQNLRDVDAASASFEVHITEEGTAIIAFGDGRHGRRLPTGQNNVRATYRKGVGPSGNLTAGHLIKIGRKNRIVDTIAQPVAAAGGANGDDVQAMRRNAPASVLTLDRAVSVLDFAHLAQRHSSVWQAHSYVVRSNARRNASVNVVVVPAGGELGTLGTEIQAFLLAHAAPGVSVTVQAYQPVPLRVNVVVRVDSTAFDAEDVVAATAAAIAERFDVQAALLGQPVYRSQLLALIESVSGVANGTVEMLASMIDGIDPPPRLTTSPSGTIRSVRPRDNQMVVLLDMADISVTSEAFVL